MRRILAILVLSVILVLAISVPALAEKPSEPPWNYGQYNSWLVQITQDQAKADPDDWIHNGYGRSFNAPIRWAIWWDATPWDNGGEYVAAMKDAYHTSK